MNRIVLALTAGLGLSTPALASVTVLDFEQISAYPTTTNVPINGYYNGGQAGNGATGPNYGVEFLGSGVVQCLNTTGEDCAGGSWGFANPSQWYGFRWTDASTAPIINVAAGFVTQFSFVYSAPYVADAAVSIWDGLNGTGNLLASLTLGLTPKNACDTSFSMYTGYCPFVAVDLAFVGTGKSVTFSGAANRSLYDNITLDIPEPATWTMLVIGAGLAARKRRRR